MKHEDKIKLAKKLRSRKEFLNKTPIFLTKNWQLRSEAIKGRILRMINKKKKSNGK